MGAVYEWARLDGRDGDDDGNPKPSFGKRRPDTFTRWDWRKWWARRGREYVVRCPARLELTRQREYPVGMAVRQARHASGTRFKRSIRAGSRDQQDLQEREPMEIAQLPRQ